VIRTSTARVPVAGVPTPESPSLAARTWWSSELSSLVVGRISLINITTPQSAEPRGPPSSSTAKAWLMAYQFDGGSLAGNDCRPHSSTKSSIVGNGGVIRAVAVVEVVRFMPLAA
jgi:hypothetical protein